MKLLSAVLLAAALVLAGCGAGGNGATSTASDSQEASVRAASEDFMSAAINREGAKVCDLSSQEAIAEMSTAFPAVGADCHKGMEELFSKLPESAIEKDEEFVERLPEAQVVVEGDTAHVTGVGTDMEFVLADGHWLLNDTEEKTPRQEREEEVEERGEEEFEERQEQREEEVGGEVLAAELEPQLEDRKPGRDQYYVRCGRQLPEEGKTFICEAETLVYRSANVQRGRLVGEFGPEGEARIASLSLHDHR
jgi:ketosteroid isomerase-like protein